MADIFISYHSADRPRAEALRRWFEECDWSVWIDREIGIGEGWEQRLQNELEAARLVVVLWSAQARRSEWVQREASAAAADGWSRQSQADSEGRLLPGSRSTPRRPRFRM